MNLLRHTGYLVINEHGGVEMITFAPEQYLSDLRSSDICLAVQGLYIENISHELWLGDVSCYRVINTPSGLETVYNLSCKIIAKKAFDWDLTKPMGQRQTNLKKSKTWDSLVVTAKRHTMIGDMQK
jgi:hypothetical protein